MGLKEALTLSTIQYTDRYKLANTAYLIARERSLERGRIRWLSHCTRAHSAARHKPVSLTNNFDEHTLAPLPIKLDIEKTLPGTKIDLTPRDRKHDLANVN